MWDGLGAILTANRERIHADAVARAGPAFLLEPEADWHDERAPFDGLLEALIELGRSGDASKARTWAESRAKVAGRMGAPEYAILAGLDAVATSVRGILLDAIEDHRRLAAALDAFELALAPLRRLYSEAHERVARRRIMQVHKTAIAFGGASDLQRLLRVIVKAAPPLVGARASALILVEAPDPSEALVAEGLDEDAASAVRSVFQRLLAPWIMQARTITLDELPVLPDDPAVEAFLTRSPPGTGVLGVPIVTRRTVAGALLLVGKRGGSVFTAEDRWLAELLAAHAASAIVNARLHGSAVERANEQEALNRVLQGAVRTLDVEPMLSGLAETASAAVGAARALVLVPDADAMKVGGRAGEAPPDDPLSDGSLESDGLGALAPVFADVLARREPYLVRDRALLGHRALRAEFERLGVGSCVAQPIVVAGRGAGLLWLIQPAGRPPLGERALRLSGSIAEQAAAVLENALAHQDLRRLKDALDAQNEALERRVAERTTELEEVNRRLGESRAELLDFVENASIGLRWVSPDGIIEWANKAELRMLGYNATEYVGRPIAEFHDDPAVADDILERVERGETLSNQPARMRCKNGSFRDVWISSSPSVKDGRFQHSRSFTLDVTREKEAERYARANQTRFEALAESAGDGIVSADGELRILYANPAVERLLGYPPGELVGSRLDVLIPERFRGSASAALQRIRTGGAPTLVGGTTEVVALCRNGSEVPIELTLSSWEGPEGTCYSGIMRDARIRKFEEAVADRTNELRASEETFRVLFESAAVGMAQTDPRGRFLRANEAFLRLHGLDEDTLRARSVRDLLHPDDAAEKVARFDLLLRGEVGSFTVECRHMHRDGAPFWAEDSVSLVRDARGRARSITIVTQDVTARRRAMGSGDPGDALEAGAHGVTR